MYAEELTRATAARHRQAKFIAHYLWRYAVVDVVHMLRGELRHLEPLVYRHEP